MSDLPVYLALGAFAGTLAGLLGVGGGLVIVPVLAWLLARDGLDADLLMHVALGTSLASIVFTSISSVRAHHRRNAVLWPVVRRLAPGIVIGAFAGAAVADLLSSARLQTIFGIFELLVAAHMAFGGQPSPQRTLPGGTGMLGAGGTIGAVSAVVGIGGGTMTVPFLVWCNVAMRQAVATSAACGLPIAVAGAAGYALMGWGNPELPGATFGYIHLPALFGIVAASVLFAPLGARLAHTVPVKSLKRFFALFLAVLGTRMLLA